MDDRIIELAAAGMVAEIEIRSVISSGDDEAMAEWVRRRSEIRTHLRVLQSALIQTGEVGGPLAEVARAVLTGLAGTFYTLTVRQTGAALRSTE